MMLPENPYREPLPRHVHPDYELVRKGQEQGWDECQKRLIDANWRPVKSVEEILKYIKEASSDSGFVTTNDVAQKLHDWWLKEG